MKYSSGYISILTALLELAAGVIAEHLVYTTSGVIGAENLTYVKLARNGAFRVELTSIKGDVDIYASEQTLNPDYFNYDVQSSTCGFDVIFIPLHFNRPVGIGIYGHPSYDESVYQLQVFEVDDADSNEASYQDYDQEQSASSSTSSPRNTNFPHKGEEEESILWNILVGFLKILFDILL